jgi:hypothetical protein
MEHQKVVYLVVLMVLRRAELSAAVKVALLELKLAVNLD